MNEEGKTAAQPETVDNPHDWELCVSVAYLRLTGLSQEQAAKSAGCGERSVQRWEASDWWPKAEKEASDRWLKTVHAKSRRALEKNLDDADGSSARWTLERLDQNFKPPKQSVDVNLTAEKAREELAALLGVNVDELPESTSTTS